MNITEDPRFDKPGGEPAEPSAPSASSVFARRRMVHRALTVLGGPVLRLHHYRDVRTKLLHDVLSARDGEGLAPDACEHRSR
jgi:hypothetical protein